MERVSFDLKIWILSQKRKIKLRKTYVYILVSSSNFNPESWWDFLSQAFIHWCFSPGELSLTWKSTLSSIMKYFEMIKNRSFSTTGNYFFTLISCYDFNHWKLLLYLDQLLWLHSKFIIWASHQRKEWVDAAILFDSLTNRMFFSADNGVSFTVIWPQKMSGTNIVGKLLSNSILVLFFSNSTYGTCILFMRLIDSSLLFEYSGLAVIKLIFVLL